MSTTVLAKQSELLPKQKKPAVAFHFGQAAQEHQKEIHKQGWSFRMEWLPYVTETRTRAQFMPAIQGAYSQDAFSLLSHADITFMNPWLPLGIYPQHASRLSNGKWDRGSVVELTYRWSSSQKSLWGKQVSIFYYPFNNSPLLLGSMFDLTWQTGFLAKKTKGAYIGTWGVEARVNRFRFVGAILIEEQRMEVSEDPDSGLNVLKDLPQAAFVTKLEAEPFDWLAAFVHGTVFSKGTFSSPDYGGKPYSGWGLQGGFTLRWGAPTQQITFLHRRRLDPRSAKQRIHNDQPLAPGLSWAFEGSLRSHTLKDPTLPKQLQNVTGLAFGSRLSGQVRRFRFSALFGWKDPNWLFYEGQGFVPTVAFREEDRLSPLWFAALEASFFPQPTLSTSVRLEWTQPATVVSNSSTTTPPTNSTTKTIVALRLRQLLDPKTEETPILMGTVAVHWSPWSFLSLFVECWGVWDGNNISYKKDQNTGIVQAKPNPAGQLGTELIIQFRY